MFTMGQVIGQGEIVLSWSRKKKKSPLLVVKDWGFCAIGFGKKKEFCCGEEPIRVRLNSENVEDGSAVSHSTRSQLQRRCVFLGGYSVFNEH